MSMEGTTAGCRTDPRSGERLAGDCGFVVLHEEEGTGLSPYEGEDPVLYRVIARR